MAKLRVTIIDEVRDRRLKVDLPDDAAMEKLLPALAKKLGLPPDAYQLTHETTEQALGGDQTLASFGVREGDALRLAAEDAVPLRQKVPVWAWVGIVVAVAVLAFVLGQILKPVPTPTVVAGVTTPAATSTAVPRPTATPVAPTFTPLPPTATRVPTNTPRPTATPVPPTDTPVLTATPRPTSTPTPTIDADPTVYDNFNNPANDGSFNQSQWKYWSDPPNQIAQQDGILVLTQDGEKPGQGTRLLAHKYYGVMLNTPTFFEARLMMSPNKHAGNVQLHLNADPPPGEEGWFSECHINDDGWAYCFDTVWPWQEGHGYDVGEKSVAVGYGTWHTFRIEVDPATMTFTYYIDGQMAGSHVPVDAEMLRKASFKLAIGVYGGEVTGYIEDVRIGPVQ